MIQPEEGSTKFEHELTEAMRGVDPPAGFADRVIARVRVPEQTQAKVLRMPLRPRMWTSGAIAAALLAGALTGEQVHLRRERERAELAQQQFEAGMRITDEALQHAREQLESAGVRFGK